MAILFALNFISPHNEELLVARKKTATIRPGDLRSSYPEGSTVLITLGARQGTKRKLYNALIDKVVIKKYSDLTQAELNHQNPEINSAEELISLFENIYERRIFIEDIVTVIHFSEIITDESSAANHLP